MNPPPRTPPLDSQPESLKDEVSNLLEELRTVLPGIQALFGFQLLAVFNDGFQKLTESSQQLHLVALLLVACAIAMLMTPAAYHRIAERGGISRRFADFGSAMLVAALLPFAFGMTLDILIITETITDSANIAYTVAIFAFVLFIVLWFALPSVARARNTRG